jgi:hypothetical protein
MRHETVVTPVPLAEIEKVLAKRWAVRWNERFPNGVPTFDKEGVVTGYRGEATKEEYAAGVKELVEGYRAEGLAEDTAWDATCKCGWAANNPLPTKQAAEADAEAHMTSIYGEA